MLQNGILKTWSLSFVLCGIALLSFISIIDDALFFHSDSISIFILGAAASAAGATLVTPVLLLIAKFRTGLDGINRTLAVGVAASILAALLVFAFSFVHAQLDIMGAIDRRWIAPCLLTAWLAVVGGAGMGIARSRGGVRIAERVTLLCVPVAPACLGLLALHLAVRHAQPAAGESAQKHVVLIVLDGWPANFLHTFNPEMAVRPVDQLFQKGRVFHGMRTNAIWTHGYFGALYWGSPEFVDRSRRAGKNPSEVAGETGYPAQNLVGELQKLGVRSRWITFHRLGIPESRPITNYTGLRSMFLTRRLAWIPRALGLDYHLVMPKSAASSLYETPWQRALFRLVGEKSGKNPLLDVLLPEMQTIRRGTNQSFLLFHALWQMGSKGEPQAWEKGGRGKLQRAVAQIRARDYRYLPDEERYARTMRNQSIRFTNALGEKLTEFFASAEAAGLLENTMVIVTADHGRIFDRGKFWYGYHPDEEVMRVPMIVFDHGVAGRDRRPRETIDITQTLFEQFGRTEPVHPRAVSLLDNRPKPFTDGITLASGKSREWFLVLYSDKRKYTFNLHPQGNGAAVEMRIKGFETRPVQRGEDVMAAKQTELVQALRDYGLADQKLHPRYAALLKR